jgi:hypothetical protein
LNEKYCQELGFKASDIRRLLLLRKIALGRSTKYYSKEYREIIRSQKQPNITLPTQKEYLLGIHDRPIPVTKLESIKSEPEMSPTYEHLDYKIERFASMSPKRTNEWNPSPTILVRVKSVLDATFFDKVLKSTDTIETFLTWLTSEFGPNYRAKMIVNGYVGTLETTNDLLALYNYGFTNSVTLYAYEAPCEPHVCEQ